MLKRFVILNSEIYAKADIELDGANSLQIIGPNNMLLFLSLLIGNADSKLPMKILHETSVFSLQFFAMSLTKMNVIFWKP